MLKKRGKSPGLGQFRGKRGIITEELPWWLIALAVLVILVIFTLILKETGTSFIDKIKDLFG